MQNLVITRLRGEDIKPYISDLAALRIKVFRDFPYLYVGDLEYEKNYLKTYTNCKESVLIIVRDGADIVGASTAIPLKFEDDEIKKPFMDANIPIDNIFYFGESVLLPQYRRFGMGYRFFHERETVARLSNYKFIAFCAVERPESHPRRPADWVPLHSFWERLGYVKHPELVVHLSWKDLDENEASPKPMGIWMKQI